MGKAMKSRRRSKTCPVAPGTFLAMGEKKGLILLATGNNHPNALSACRLCYDKQIDRVVIYATKDMVKRGQALQNYVAAVSALLNNEIAPELKHAETNASDEFAQYLRALLEESKTWILNATGGMKTFTFRIGEAIGHPNLDRVIYREESGAWYSISRTNGTLEIQLMPPQAEGLGIPLKDGRRDIASVLSLQMTDPADFDYVKHFPPTTKDADLQTLAQYSKNSMLDAFDKIYNKEPEKVGDLLEDVVARCCSLLGYQTFQGVRPLYKHRLREDFEVDVLALRGSDCLHFDCKLIGADSPDQPKKVHQVWHSRYITSQLFGPRSIAVLVRPLWRINREVSDTAAMAGVKLIDGRFHKTFFKAFAEQFGRNDEIAQKLADIGGLYNNTPLSKKASKVQKSA